MSLLLAGSWNNVESLAKYHGPMDVFGAEKDQVISVRHAQALAASRPQAKFHLLRGGHNDWSMQPEVRDPQPLRVAQGGGYIVFVNTTVRLLAGMRTTC